MEVRKKAAWRIKAAVKIEILENSGWNEIKIKIVQNKIEATGASSRKGVTRKKQASVYYLINGAWYWEIE